MTPCTRWPQAATTAPGSEGPGARVGPSCQANPQTLSEEDLALQPQAVSGGICSGGGIWKVQRVRKKRGVIGGGRQAQTPGVCTQTDRQTAARRLSHQDRTACEPELQAEPPPDPLLQSTRVVCESTCRRLGGQRGALWR